MSLIAVLPAAVTEVDSLESHQVARAQGGDAAAFRWLFERHRADVFRWLRDLLADHDLAREGTQETFVRVHARLSSLRDPARFRPWLLGMARRVSLELGRQRRRTVPLAAAVEKAARAPDPEAALIGRESERALDRALQKLSEERRAALVLCLDHQLEYASIAEILDWSLAKVKVEIHRARLELREELREYTGGRS